MIEIIFRVESLSLMKDEAWTPRSRTKLGIFEMRLYTRPVGRRERTKVEFGAKTDRGFIPVRSLSGGVLEDGKEYWLLPEERWWDFCQDVVNAVKKSLSETRPGEVMRLIQDSRLNPRMTETLANRLCAWEWDQYKKLPVDRRSGIFIFGTTSGVTVA